MSKSLGAWLLVAALVVGCGGGGGGDGDGGACPSGQTLCSGVCTNTRLDPQHCGSCATYCAAGEVCANGTCATECPVGLTDCSGACTNTTFDPQHCGTCTTACDSGEVCADGACVASCPPGFTDCSGACTDLTRDELHCGSCETSCNTGASCVSGNCMLVCPPGQTNCSGTCTNMKIDPQHCGNCTTACDSGQLCVNGQCASFCGAGTTWCAAAGMCVDLQRDPAHCGACGNACTGTLACHYGRCSSPRAGGTVDSWGELWDGLQRPAANWATASAACLAAGGRLPTITELNRVNATDGTGELSDTTATAPLWTQIPWDGTPATPSYAVVPLSTGTPAAQTATAAVAYRCVWPDATDAFFGENACHGPPGATCTDAAGRPGYHFDSWDRPFMSYLAASVECGLAHARVPLQIELVEAITGTPALGEGSNLWVWTSDQMRYDYVQLLRWNKNEPAANYTDVGTYVSYSAKGATGRVRCLGPGFDPGAHPATIVGEYVAPTTHLKGEIVDRAAALLPDAASACFEAGGHLPLAHEIGELIRAGLPDGSSTWLWTADATSYRYQEIVMWAGIRPLFAGVYAATTPPSEATWSDRTTTRLSRCVYVPVDAAFAAPTCNGGCFAVEHGPVKVWADSFDRTPATYLDAVKTCVGAGGHLGHSRDYLELVRAGLPNGSAVNLWTSDAAGGEAPPTPPSTPDASYTLVVKWTGVAAAFDLGSPTYATHLSKAGGATAAYRCVWSNEYR